MKTAAILTVSDSSFQAKRADSSGPAIVKLLEARGFTVVKTAIVPDETEQIQKLITDCVAQAKLFVTVGGTGIAARDVTPEATLAVVDKIIPGIAEKMRLEGQKKTPFAALSRGVCGVKNGSLILNLPGSPAAATESLAAVIEVLPHALDLLSGNTEH